MLKELRIRNLAVVESLTVPFGPGLNVLTGETGAGKSILIDALTLLLGERAQPSEAIRARGGKRIVVCEDSYRGKLPRREGVRARQGVQDSRDIKIAKPLCLCKNVMFGPSNAKFAKMHKSNAKL
jgi:DNA repair ATPase RecN